MKRALLLVLVALSLTGCAVRAGYYSRHFWSPFLDNLVHTSRLDFMNNLDRTNVLGFNNCQFTIFIWVS